MKNIHYIFALFFLILLPGCSKSQEPKTGTTGREDSTIVSDSLVIRMNRSELKEILLSKLDRTEKYFRNASKKDESDHLIHSENSVFQTLTVISEALDKERAYVDVVREEEKKFALEDSIRKGKAAKILNGMVSIHSMYSLLYTMRFRNDRAKMEELSDMHEALAKKLQPQVPAIEAVSLMANNIFKISKMIMQDIDVEKLYSATFSQINEQYRQGVEAATIEEDHFLNGIYRTFEVCQLWAIFLDPRMRTDISNLNKKLYSANSRATNYGEQMALAMEYLYKITDILARKTIEVTF